MSEAEKCPECGSEMTVIPCPPDFFDRRGFYNKCTQCDYSDLW